MKGVAKTPAVSFADILLKVQSVKQAEITSWQDIDRLDVRPNKGIIKVRSKNNWEVQLDGKTGDVLHTAYRRPDFIESLHDATFFHDKANLWFMLPCAIILLLLWLTGLYLFVYPYIKKRT